MSAKPIVCNGREFPIYKCRPGSFPEKHPEYDLFYVVIFSEGELWDFVAVRFPADIKYVREYIKFMDIPYADCFHLSDRIDLINKK